MGLQACFTILSFSLNIFGLDSSCHKTAFSYSNPTPANAEIDRCGPSLLLMLGQAWTIILDNAGMDRCGPSLLVCSPIALFMSFPGPLRLVGCYLQTEFTSNDLYLAS